jgi:hypothetical protein
MASEHTDTSWNLPLERINQRPAGMLSTAGDLAVIPEWPQWPTTGHRPEPTLNLRSDSGGNASVNCRSTEDHVEWQLLDPANASSVPTAVVADLAKRTVRTFDVTGQRSPQAGLVGHRLWNAAITAIELHASASGAETEAVTRIAGRFRRAGPAHGLRHRQTGAARLPDRFVIADAGLADVSPAKQAITRPTA